MNTTTGRIRLLACVLMGCLFSLEQSTAAESNCREVEGEWIDVYPGTGNVSTGRIRNAGLLRGTTETVYDSAPLSTPDPTTVSYTADLTITTNRGQMKIRNVYIYDLARGLFTIIGRLNPNTSTGRFAGATGVLFPSGKAIGDGFTYRADITGEVCFADR